MGRAQVVTDAKSNGINAVSALLDLKGTIVTADALTCQRDFARQIVDGGGDGCLAPHGNPSALHDDVRRPCDGPESETVTMKPFVDGDQERIESRTATVTAAAAWLAARGWPGPAAIGKVVPRREIGGRTSTVTAYDLLSMPLSPERLNEIARLHRGYREPLPLAARALQERRPGSHPSRERPPQHRRPPPLGPQCHAEGRLQGLAPRQVQARRMERCLPGKPPRRVLKCDPSATFAGHGSAI